MDDKNVMQFEYWSDHTGWVFDATSATLYTREQAKNVAFDIDNDPPSDGRVHIAKRMKKADSVKCYVVRSTNTKTGRVEWYQGSEYGVWAWFVSKKDAVLLTKQEAVAVVAKEKARHEGSEWKMSIAKRTKKAKQKPDLWDDVFESAGVPRRAKKANYVVRATSDLDCCISYYSEGNEGYSWLPKGDATRLSKSQAKQCLKEFKDTVAGFSLKIVKLVKKAKPINQPVAQSEKVEDKKEYVIYCEQYKTYWKVGEPFWITDKSKAALMSNKDAVYLAAMTNDATCKVIKVSGTEIPDIQEYDYVIRWTNLDGRKYPNAFGNFQYWTLAGWRKLETDAHRFSSEKEANDECWRRFPNEVSVSVVKLPKQAKQPEVEYDYVLVRNYVGSPRMYWSANNNDYWNACVNNAFRFASEKEANDKRAVFVNSAVQVAKLPKKVCDKKVWHVDCHCDAKANEQRDYIITRTKLGGMREVLTEYGWDSGKNHSPNHYTRDEAEKEANSISQAIYDKKNTIIAYEKEHV